MIKHGRLRIGKHIETDVFSLAIGFSLLLCADGALLCSMFISALLHEMGHLMFFAFLACAHCNVSHRRIWCRYHGEGAVVIST